MNNNTQIETVEEEVIKLEDAANKYVEAKEDRCRAYGMVYAAFVNGANWQKQQDEAKYNSLSVDELLLEREKLENLIKSKDEMALINYELKQLEIDELPKSYITDLEYKYKELLDSHNELLKNLEKAIEWIDDDFSKGLYLEVINKAKNIKL